MAIRLFDPDDLVSNSYGSSKLISDSLNNNFEELYQSKTSSVNVFEKGIPNDGASIVDKMNVLLGEIGSTPTDLYWPKGSYYIDADYIFPSNVHHIFASGFEFLGDVLTRTVTINGRIEKLGTNEIYNTITPIISKKQYVNYELVEKPSLFAWDAPINIYRSVVDSSKIFTDFNVSDYKYEGNGKSYFVDVENGSDANDGLRLSKAYKTIKKALEQSDVDIVYVSSGYYNTANGFNKVVLGRSVSIIALPDNYVRVAASEDLTWSLTAAQTYTYEATTTDTAYLVNDSSKIDSENNFKPYTLQTSIATVEANAGSFWVDGTTVYVHPFDSRTPDDDINVYQNTVNFSTALDGELYLEGINIEGGNSGAFGGAALIQNNGGVLNFYAKNCTFKYSQVKGIRINGANSYMQNCEANYNFIDGFSYHSSGEIPNVIEVDCRASHSGPLDGSGGTENGSTGHGGSSIIRINCKFSKCQGPIVADVQDCITWCLACISFGSATSTNEQSAGFQVSDLSEKCTAYLDSCIGFGSYSGLSVRNSDSSVFTKNCDFTGEIATGIYNPNNATIEEY